MKPAEGRGVLGRFLQRTQQEAPEPQPEHITSHRMRPESNITEVCACTCGWTDHVIAGYGNAAARAHARHHTQEAGIRR
jgi:hypothetical protein